MADNPESWNSERQHPESWNTGSMDLEPQDS